MEKSKRYRKRKAIEEESDGEDASEIRSVVEEVKLVQKQRERIRAQTTDIAGPGVAKNTAPSNEPNQNAEAEGGGEELVLQDTFEQEAAVTVEDPNMLKYIDQELAKRRGRASAVEKEENPSAEDNLYVIPEHLKVKLTSAEEGSTSWTTGIAEVQLPIDYKLKNIEETEAAKKALQEKRPFVAKSRSNSTIPASFSADYFQRGREYAERLRKDHPELFKDKDSQGIRSGVPSVPRDVSAMVALAAGPPLGSRGATLGEFQSEDRNRRLAATDDILLERFRKRERNRVRR